MNFARSLVQTHQVPSVPSSELGREYKRRISRERTLISSSIELTYRCNLHCTHCYCPPGDRQAELTTDEVHRLLDDLAEMGTLFLLLTGGDPLLRKDFPELYRHAKQLGMLVTVFTNGTLIDDEICALWAEWPPSLVEISLYGLTRETYERVVAVSNSFDRCLAGIQRVLAAGHPVALKTPVTRENSHEIHAIGDFAKDLGVEFRYDPVILATMEGDRSPHALRLDAEEIVALEARDPEKHRAWGEYLGREAERALPSKKLFSCGAGQNSLHVDPYGNVQVCLMVKNFRHSLRERPLSEIYYEEFPQILALEREPDSKCGSCGSRSTCNNCPGIALWETRSNQSHVEFQCSLTAVREASYAGAPGDAAGSDATAAASAAPGCGKGEVGRNLLQIGGNS